MTEKNYFFKREEKEEEKSSENLLRKIKLANKHFRHKKKPGERERESKHHEKDIKSIESVEVTFQIHFVV